MKTILVGGTDVLVLHIALMHAFLVLWEGEEPTKIISCGVDPLGERIAAQLGIPVVQFAARWPLFGRVSEYVRNTQMIEYADCLVAVWDGKNDETKRMIDAAKKRGLRSYVHGV